MNRKEFKWESKDGNSMYGRSWIPEEYHTVICLVHGMGEHITRYDDMADYYNRNGIALIGYDHRGHGKSDGKRGHADNIDQLLDDIQEFYNQNRGLFENKKSILYGHSLGGSLVLNFGLRRSHSFDGIISSAPFIDLAFKPNPIVVFIGKLLHKIFPRFQQPTDLDPDAISSVKAEVRKYREDELVHDRISLAMGMASLDAGKWLQENNNDLSVPTLIMHGTDDQITSHLASKKFASKRNKVDFKEWPGHYHEIHNEFNRTKVYDFAIDWINKVSK